MQNAKAEKEEKRTGCYRHTQMQKDLIIEKLKEFITGLPHWTRRSVWQRYTV